MLTWIVAHSDTLYQFLVPLLVGFSAAQLRHALNCVEALLICTSQHVTTQPRPNLDGFCIEKHTYSSDNGDDATNTPPNTRASSRSIPARGRSRGPPG